MLGAVYRSGGAMALRDASRSGSLLDGSPTGYTVTDRGDTERSGGRWTTRAAAGWARGRSVDSSTAAG